MLWTEEMFKVKKPIIAMLHLDPLPGDPRYRYGDCMETVAAHAREDLRALQEGGVDGVLFSNEFSLPYQRHMSFVTPAAMARVIGELKSELAVPYGVDCISDGAATLELAAAVDAKFVRGTFCGVYVGDGGLYDNDFSALLRRKAALHLDELKMLYFINPESDRNLDTRPLADIASSTIFKAHPDGLCISASAAGTQGDTQSMAQECSAITAYSAGMRERAEEMERSARLETQVIRDKTADIMAMLDQAIEKSHSVEQIRSLTEDILSISSSTNLIAVNASIEAARAGAAGAGFSVVAQEVHKLADSCAETANHIQKVSEVVTGAVDYLAGSARELADYLGRVIAEQLERSVQAGQQYREDSDYIGSAMEEFNDRAERLKSAIDQIAVSISSISGSIDGAASGISGAAGSTRILVDDMEGITGRMDANQEIVGELQKQMDMFAIL